MLDPLDSFEVEPPLEVSSSGPPVAPGLGALVDELLGATVAVLSGWSEGGRIESLDSQLRMIVDERRLLTLRSQRLSGFRVPETVDLENATSRQYPGRGDVCSRDLPLRPGTPTQAPQCLQGCSLGN